MKELTLKLKQMNYTQSTLICQFLSEIDPMSAEHLRLQLSDQELLSVFVATLESENNYTSTEEGRVSDFFFMKTHRLHAIPFMDFF